MSGANTKSEEMSLSHGHSLLSVPSDPKRLLVTGSR